MITASSRPNAAFEVPGRHVVGNKRSPPAVPTARVKPRLENAASEPTPGPPNVIPTSSQRPGKRTNDTLPYGRMVFTEFKDSAAYPADMLPGDVLMVHRTQACLGHDSNRASKAATWRQVNALFSEVRVGSTALGRGMEDAVIATRRSQLNALELAVEESQQVTDRIAGILRRPGQAVPPARFPVPADVQAHVDGLIAERDAVRAAHDGLAAGVAGQTFIPRIDWRAVPVVKDWSPDGVLLSRDDDEHNASVFEAGQGEAGVMLNIAVQGKAIVRNSEKNNFSSEPGQFIQIIDPEPRAMDMLYLLLVCNENRDASGVFESFSFRFKPTSSRIIEHAIVSYTAVNADLYREYPVPGCLSLYELLNCVAAWKLGTVMDSTSVLHPEPKVTVNICITPVSLVDINFTFGANGIIGRSVSSGVLMNPAAPAAPAPAAPAPAAPAQTDEAFTEALQETTIALSSVTSTLQDGENIVQEIDVIELSGLSEEEAEVANQVRTSLAFIRQQLEEAQKLERLAVEAQQNVNLQQAGLATLQATTMVEGVEYAYLQMKWRLTLLKSILLKSNREKSIEEGNTALQEEQALNPQPNVQKQQLFDSTVSTLQESEVILSEIDTLVEQLKGFEDDAGNQLITELKQNVVQKGTEILELTRKARLLLTKLVRLRADLRQLTNAPVPDGWPATGTEWQSAVGLGVDSLDTVDSLLPTSNEMPLQADRLAIRGNERHERGVACLMWQHNKWFRIMNDFRSKLTRGESWNGPFFLTRPNGDPDYSFVVGFSLNDIQSQQAASVLAMLCPGDTLMAAVEKAKTLDTNVTVDTQTVDLSNVRVWNNRLYATGCPFDFKLANVDDSDSRQFRDSLIYTVLTLNTDPSDEVKQAFKEVLYRADRLLIDSMVQATQDIQVYRGVKDAIDFERMRRSWTAATGTKEKAENFLGGIVGGPQRIMVQFRILKDTWILPIGKLVPYEWECYDEREIVLHPNTDYVFIGSYPSSVANTEVQDIAAKSYNEEKPAYLV